MTYMNETRRGMMPQGDGSGKAGKVGKSVGRMAGKAVKFAIGTTLTGLSRRRR